MTTPTQTTTVMVVEDDAPLRATLATSLHAHGYAVTEAASAEEAIVLTEQRAPDLLLLDLTLPGADGLVALRRLRAFTDVPIVVLTVRDGKTDKLAALDGGADDYVTKPFDLDELLARIRAALRRTPDSETRPSVVRIGTLEIDIARGLVTRDGTEVHLTPTEWRFLELLVTSDGGSSRTPTSRARSPRHAAASSIPRRSACSSGSCARSWATTRPTRGSSSPTSGSAIAGSRATISRAGSP